MPRFTQPDDFTKALIRLNEHLMDLNSHHYHLILCKGSSLYPIGLLVDGDEGFQAVLFSHFHGQPSHIPMPWHITQAAHRVAEELVLEYSWLPGALCQGPCASGPRFLPKGFQERLTRQPIGDNLTVYWLSREDSIRLKLFSAADKLSSSYAKELNALQPTLSELREASQWARGVESSGAFRHMLDCFMVEYPQRLLWH